MPFLAFWKAEGLGYNVSMKTQPRIVSGIRASGKLHIGNYLGALKQFIDIQNSTSYECFFFIADLHALTTPFDPKTLARETLDVVAEYLACGLDPKLSTIFLQSTILEHTELAWIFNCITPLGELERMTQFKDKSKQHGENINAGLLTYPVLMAADILLYKPAAVPVGEDQIQHLELARTIARKFNAKFGKVFPEPKSFVRTPIRIKSLQNPEKKMSKTSDSPLFIADTKTEIDNKIKKAVTASTGNRTAPGVENLLFLLGHFASKDTLNYFLDQQSNGTLKFSELKHELSNAINSFFSPVREKKKEILADKNFIAQTLAEGAERARSVARSTLKQVKQKIGLV